MFHKASGLNQVAGTARMWRGERCESGGEFLGPFPPSVFLLEFGISLEISIGSEAGEGSPVDVLGLGDIAISPEGDGEGNDNGVNCDKGDDIHIGEGIERGVGDGGEVNAAEDASMEAGVEGMGDEVCDNDKLGVDGGSCIPSAIFL